MNSHHPIDPTVVGGAAVCEELRDLWPEPAETVEELGRRLATLLDLDVDDLPRPGSGGTLRRWQTLAEVAALDLGLVKLFEGHTDALAILAELGAESGAGDNRWAVWAAEPPDARVQVEEAGEGILPGAPVLVNGRKAWCSGAQIVSHGLVTTWCGDQRHLVAIAMAQRGVTVTDDGWCPVGMAATASVDVTFDDASGILVGPAGAYLTRPGFWHGGAGIAACWWGGASRVAEYLLDHYRRRTDAHASAHLGAVDSALASGAATLREAARQFDEHPRADARASALRVRAHIEDVVERVLRHSGRALGATPFCRNRPFARLVADLPVFLRQSHGERDLARLGEALAGHRENRPWRLSP